MVRYHFVKPKDKFKKWSPRNIDAPASAVGIDTQYNLHHESNNSVPTCPNNKPAAEAIKLTKKGKSVQAPTPTG